MNVRLATDIIWASLYKTRPVVALGELPIHVLPGPAHTHTVNTHRDSSYSEEQNCKHLARGGKTRQSMTSTSLK